MHFTDAPIKAKNRTKSRIRSRIEYSIGEIRWVFGLSNGRHIERLTDLVDSPRHDVERFHITLEIGRV